MGRQAHNGSFWIEFAKVEKGRKKAVVTMDGR